VACGKNPHIMPLHSKYQLQIKTLPRLAVAFGLTFVYTLALFILAMYGERGLHQVVLRYSTDVVPSLRTIGAVQTNLELARRHGAQYLTTSTAAEMTELENQLMQDRTRVQASLESYRKRISGAQDAADYEKVASLTQSNFEIQDRVIALSRNRGTAGQQEAAVKLWLGDQRQVMAAMNDTLSAWSKHHEEKDAEALSKSEEIYRHGMYALIAVACMALVSCVFAAFRLAASITRPLYQALELAKAVSTGDLTQRVDLAGSDEMCELVQALNDMSSTLSRLITDVLRSAQTVGATADEISQSNDELSQRTQGQAASLEETAASMEEITSLGKNNSNNARNADKLAHEARDLAEDGEQVVAKAVAAMSAINEGSSKISNIIGVIDEIAFQTNLLALNAAVEAARAGEHGRGFAVVASEVRGLAQRSADAAKQIKALIIDSADKVRTGSELVDRSGQSLSKILHSVREMSSLIKDIASASHEQAQGVQRINEVILHLDGATQQNAALVEEGSAASRVLQQQADTLSRSAAFFTVEGTGRQPPAQRARISMPGDASAALSGRDSVAPPVPVLKIARR
jgi:methyl-accepting chemotaxis protein